MYERVNRVRKSKICSPLRVFDPRLNPLREGGFWCGLMRLVNRESPRILANRIFLAFGCYAPADHLRKNRTLSGKMLLEKPACGFFFHSDGISALFRYRSSEYMTRLHSSFLLFPKLMRIPSLIPVAFR